MKNINVEPHLLSIGLLILAGCFSCARPSEIVRKPATLSSNEITHESVYPESDWSTAEPTTLGFAPNDMKEFEDYAFKDTPLWRTDGVLIVYRGKIIFERYKNGFDQKKRHHSWSMAKSFASVLFGIAESQGAISRNESTASLFGASNADLDASPWLKKDTLYNELSMSSGRKWKEDYTVLGALTSDVTHMLYGEGHSNMAQFTLSHPLSSEPGDVFNYNSGNSNIIMAALKNRLGSRYDSFPWEALFDPIGMSHVGFEQDLSGSYVGGTDIYATPRDFARFGLLLMHDGIWAGKEIIPSEWIKLSTRNLSPPFLTGSKVSENLIKYHFTYGAGFWLNQGAPRFGITTPLPDVPGDAFMALGHQGQSIFVIPSLDLVVVRVAHDDCSGKDADYKINWNTYLKPLMRAALSAEGRAP